MANASSSTLILFIAAITIAAGVAGTLYTEVSSLTDSVSERVDSLSETIETEISIISDPGSDAIYDDSTDETTILVKNTGETTLESNPEQVDVLLDGEFIGSESVTVVTGSEWGPGDVARISIDQNLNNGEHRVVVIVNGEREVLNFFV